MIPKIIHWCWLSNDPMPRLVEACIESWKEHLPDYEIKLWNLGCFDVDSIPYVAQAVKARKWAFACDYIRAYALYTEGGIYMDSDMFVRKNFDFVLSNRAFSVMEIYPEEYVESREKGLINSIGIKRDDVKYIHGVQIQAAFLGSEKGHPFFKDVLGYYHSHSFIKDDGTIDTEMIAPFVYANLAIKYGFRFIDTEQQLSEGFKLYDVTLCAPVVEKADKNSITIHCCMHSWTKEETPVQKKYKNLRIYIRKILNSFFCYEDRTIKALKKIK